MYPFPNSINNYFNFLSDFGFSITEKEEINENLFGNGYYIFSSEKVRIEIVLDRGQVLMRIGKATQAKRDWLEWSIILAAYAPDKNAYDFDINVDSQTKRLSELIKAYCIEILDGNFSNNNLHVEIANKIGKDFLTRFLQT